MADQVRWFIEFGAHYPDLTDAMVEAAARAIRRHDSTDEFALARAANAAVLEVLDRASWEKTIARRWPWP